MSRRVYVTANEWYPVYDVQTVVDMLNDKESVKYHPEYYSVANIISLTDGPQSIELSDTEYADYLRIYKEFRDMQTLIGERSGGSVE